MGGPQLVVLQGWPGRRVVLIRQPSMSCGIEAIVTSRI
jgi:hypothetical protein